MWESHVMQNVLGALSHNKDFSVVSYQQPVMWDDLRLSGHLDLVVKWQNKRLMFDIKTMSPNAYAMINSINDLRISKHHYHQGYIVQAGLYAVHPDVSAEWTGLLCVNKVTGDWKQMLWHITECEEEIDYGFEAADCINRTIDAKCTLSHAADLLANPGEYCRDCRFTHSCPLFLRIEKAKTIPIEDEKLVALINERHHLKAKLLPNNKRLQEVEYELRRHWGLTKPGTYALNGWRVKVSRTEDKIVPEYTRKGYMKVTYRVDE
jgi:hypothetical protein